MKKLLLILCVTLLTFCGLTATASFAFAEEPAPPVVEQEVEPSLPSIEGDTVATAVVEKVNTFVDKWLTFLCSAGVGVLVSLVGIIKSMKSSGKITTLKTAYQSLQKECEDLKGMFSAVEKAGEQIEKERNEFSAMRDNLAEEIRKAKSVEQVSIAENTVLLNTIVSNLEQIKKASGNAWKNVDGVQAIYGASADVKGASALALENQYLVAKIKELGGQSTEEIIAECKNRATNVGA